MFMSVQSRNRIAVNTNSGPVPPRMMRGCPANRPKSTPLMRPLINNKWLNGKCVSYILSLQILPEIRDSMVAILFSVASPKRPPKATIGARQAKYKNNNDNSAKSLYKKR